MPVWKIYDDLKVLFTNELKATSEKSNSYQKKQEAIVTSLIKQFQKITQQSRRLISII